MFGNRFVWYFRSKGGQDNILFVADSLFFPGEWVTTAVAVSDGVVLIVGYGTSWWRWSAVG
jgi:hypothetical protein